MTEQLKYIEPEWASRQQALSNILHRVHFEENIVSLALNDQDAAFLEAFMLGFLVTTDNQQHKKLALVTLGHIARLHRRISYEETRRAVEATREDPYCKGTAEDTLDDFEIFVDRQRNSDHI
ncbi:MAG: hypothetical protein IPK69_09440 [Phycisphaerales bacterium]|nr:MAG: hypothetical protein IPK69_09440 [Phycisphaerales bacterium]